MVFKQMLELYDILDDINADGRRVEEYLRSIQKDADVEAYPIYGDKGKTDVVKVCVTVPKGREGRFLKTMSELSAGAVVPRKAGEQYIETKII